MRTLSFLIAAAFLATSSLPALPVVEAASTTMYHIVSTGQSLSLGIGGAPALSTTQPYSNVMLSGTTSFTPLKESGVETMSSGMANTITALTSNDTRVAVTRNGVSGALYSAIKKGTTSFTNGLNHVRDVKTVAGAAGLTSRVIAVTAIHGESDQIYSTTTAQYEENLKQWQIDYNADIKAITNQTQDIPLFTDQMTAYARTSGGASNIPLAQLAAAENNPGKVILVAPKYFLTYTDGVHMNNQSYRLLGEYYGKVIKKVIVDGQAWKPLSPISIERQDAVINVKFLVPAGSLQFDTTLMASKTNKGFAVTGSTNSAAISNVEIVGTDTVKITLNKVPTGNLRLTYGYNGTATAGGNLRDTDSTPSINGSKLYNWAVLFDKPVTVSTASSTSSVTSSSSVTSVSSSSVSFSSSTPASSSSSSTTTAQCNDGIDNDGDGRTDFQNGFGDYGCDSINDTTEGPNPECSDRVDNADMEDTAIDEQDIGCYVNGFYNPRGATENNTPASSSSSSATSSRSSVTSSSTSSSTTSSSISSSSRSSSSVSSSSSSINGIAQCNDGIDNDGDGRIDFKNGYGDYGCDNMHDNTEGPNAECSDGIDNSDSEDSAADAQDIGCYEGGYYNPRKVSEGNAGSSSSATTANFSINVTDDESKVKSGDDLEYEITVTNKSNFTVSNVTVTNEVSKYVDVDDCSHNCSESGRKQTWSNLTFGPNEKKTFSVEVEVKKKGKGEKLKTTARVANKSDKDSTTVKK